MTLSEHMEPREILLLVPGIKGTIGTTLAVAAAALREDPQSVRSSLTTAGLFGDLLPLASIHVAGWDLRPEPMADCLHKHGVLPEPIIRRYREDISLVRVIGPEPPAAVLGRQVDRLLEDIERFREDRPDSLPVLLNLLPAAPAPAGGGRRNLAQLYADRNWQDLPDLAYALAAVRARIPVVNFTPNSLELPAFLELAEESGVPTAGRDGKTGQTYFKLVLAEALKARSLYIDGWYSLNILGNEDGRNLMDPERAKGKLANKTDILDRFLGYPVGERYGKSAHKVRIDYYPPRGDAKEAWDVIDFLGLFDMPMGLRINLQGRDSILAAPMAIDLCRWMAVLQMLGRKGPVPELGFYFKMPVGDDPPLGFVDQLSALERLKAECAARLGG